MTKMHRTYAAIKLLEHGPLSFTEFNEITGWPENQCRMALKKLAANKRVYRGRGKTGEYQLTPTTNLRGAVLAQFVMSNFARAL